MATHQITLLLDDDRSEAETMLLKYIKGLKRNERQQEIRDFLMFSCKLKCDDPVLFDAVAALTNLDGVERDSFITLGETIARYRNTDQVVQEAKLDRKPEQKVSERVVEVKPEPIAPAKPRGVNYTQ